MLAIPVAPTDTLAELRQEADEIVCLEEYQEFSAIGFYYSNFNQLEDSDVREILARVQGA